MNTVKYRFYEMQDGQKMYLRFVEDGQDYTTNKSEATLFTEGDWLNWGKDDKELYREEIGEDEKLRAIGASTLPGF